MRATGIMLAALAGLATTTAVRAAETATPAEQAEARALYKALVETNTTHAHGSTAAAKLLPKEPMASQETLRDLSRTSKSSVPKVWPTELIDQVTWCSSAMRTRLAQKKAVSAPCQVSPHSPPISAGRTANCMLIPVP